MLDSSAAQHYNYFRDYDAAIGRYLESDPIGLGGGSNTYVYVAANPLVRSDPTGENWQALRGAWWIGSRLGAAINQAFNAATGMSIGSAIYYLCHEAAQNREARCKGNLERDMETCSKGSRRFGKKWFKVCEGQAMTRYGNCLAGRDGEGGVNAPLPPWGGI